MTAPRAGVAHWKARARRAEETVKARSDYDEIALLAARWREHERVAAEVEPAATEVRHEVLLQLANAEVRAAAADRMTSVQAWALVEGIDLERYVSNGDVDVSAIRQFVSAIAPVARAGVRS